MSPRIACLLVPDLPLWAELRAHPELAGLPLVVASGADARADIIALSPEARAEGVRGFGTVAQARAVCPEVSVRVASPALERAARDTLLDITLSLSPRAALAPRGSGLFTSEGSVFLDASGVASLFRSEEGFVSVLAARAAKQGLPGAVSLASSQAVALLVARCIAGEPCATKVLAPGQENAFLGPLSIDLLDPDDALAQALTRFGVHTVRDLLRLPRKSLAGRLGPEILGLAARARGEEVEAPLPEPHSNTLREAMDLDTSIVSLEPLGFVLRGMLSRLMERLALRSLACGPLDLELALEGGGHDARRVGVATPTLDVRVLLRLTTLALAQHPPNAPIEGLSIHTQGETQRRDQLDLFRPNGPDPVALSETLSQLESLCGEGRVGAPEVPNTHHPAAFGLKPFAPPPTRAPRSTRSSSSSPSREGSGMGGSAGTGAGVKHRAEFDRNESAKSPALRALRPPVRAEIRVDRGQPSYIRSAVTRGDVLMAAGPWRTTGHWWSEANRFVLDHFDIQVSDGMVVRLCFDWLQQVWQIDGIYD